MCCYFANTPTHRYIPMNHQSHEASDSVYKILCTQLILRVAHSIHTFTTWRRFTLFRHVEPTTCEMAACREIGGAAKAHSYRAGKAKTMIRQRSSTTPITAHPKQSSLGIEAGLLLQRNVRKDFENDSRRCICCTKAGGFQSRQGASAFVLTG